MSPVSIATRCFPEAGVRVVVTQSGVAGGGQAAVEVFIDAIGIDP